MSKNYLFPSTLVIEPANVCNLSCVMCEANCTVNKHINNVVFITVDQMNKIINNLKGYISNIVFQGDCEPTMNPHLPEMVGLASKLVKNIAVVTNGTMLNKERALQFVKNGVTWFSISIDDYRAEKYDRIRVGTSFVRTMDNLSNLIEIRDKGENHFIISLHKIVFPEDTLSDIIDFINKFYVELGVNRISLASLVSKGVMKVKNLSDLIKEAEEHFKNKGIAIDISDPSPYPHCEKIHEYCGSNLFFVNYLGEFKPCPFHSRSRYSFGSLYRQNIEEIVNNPLFTKYHQFWQNEDFNGELPVICMNCFFLQEKIRTHKISL